MFIEYQIILFIHKQIDYHSDVRFLFSYHHFHTISLTKNQTLRTSHYH